MPPFHRRLLQIAAGLFCLGVLYLARSALQAPTRAGALKPGPIHITISGNLELPTGVEAGQVESHLHFPEIPLDVFPSAAKSPWIEKTGKFCLEVSIAAVTRPTKFDLKVSAPGGSLEMQGLSLTQQSADHWVAQLNSLRLGAVVPRDPELRSQGTERRPPAEEVPPGTLEVGKQRQAGS